MERFIEECFQWLNIAYIQHKLCRGTMLLTLTLSFWSYLLQITPKGMKMMIIVTTVANTAIAARKFSRENTVAKSMVFGPVNTPAPRPPSKLLLKRISAGEESSML